MLTISGLAILAGSVHAQIRPKTPPRIYVGVKSVSGLKYEAEVTDFRDDKVNTPRRTSNSVPVSFSFKVGLAGPSGWYDWLDDLFLARPTPRSIWVRMPASTGKPGAVRTFQSALITEIAFPRLDGGSRDAVYLQVRVVAETMTLTPDSAGPPPTADPDARQKRWLADNFRLELGKLPTEGITSIEAFTLKRSNIPRPNRSVSSFNVVFDLSESLASQWPIKKLERPKLKSKGNEVAIESLEISHEGVTMGLLQVLGPSRNPLATLELGIYDLRAAPAPVAGKRRITLIADRVRFRIG